MDTELAAAVLVTVLLTSLQAVTGLAPLLVFVFLLYRLQPVVKAVEKDRVDLLSLKSAVSEVFLFIQKREKEYVGSGDVAYDGFSDCITMDCVGFKYGSDDQPALGELSVNFPTTGITAIVGPSGAGKSTLINLLLRFFDPTEGEILVDGVRLDDLDLASWRNRISVVNQKVFLFNATVRENIAYGVSQADDNQVIHAAKVAGAHDFITKLPQGYDSAIGENGVELSGGEGQRICLARAMIRKPEILILDEATNTLDSISEKLIQDALESLREKCTVIVIVHRLATIERADQILVIDKGKLVEQGNLTELVKQSGLFSKLYALQSMEKSQTL